jgi:ABC-type multidrug transport system fused ATPase/permease subunit
MEECIDIFSRLLIATITFVVPILINLLSSFTEGEKRRKELAQSTEEEIKKKALEEIHENPDEIRITVSKTNKEYSEIDRKTKSELALLNPISQFWKIFTFLGLSLFFLLFDYLIRDNTWNLYNHNLSMFILILTGITYLIGLFFAIRILYTISKTRKILSNN